MTLKPPDGQNSENRPQGKIRREDITPETLPEGYKVALQQTGAIPEMPDWAKERFAEIWADTYAIAHFNVRRSVRPNPVLPRVNRDYFGTHFNEHDLHYDYEFRRIIAEPIVKRETEELRKQIREKDEQIAIINHMRHEWMVMALARQATRRCWMCRRFGRPITNESVKTTHIIKTPFGEFQRKCKSSEEWGKIQESRNFTSVTSIIPT